MMLLVLRVSKSVCQSQPVTSQLSHFVHKPHNNVSSQLIRMIGRDSRSGFQTVKQGIGQQAKRKTLKETLLSPATDTPFAIGRGIVIESLSFSNFFFFAFRCCCWWCSVWYWSSLLLRNWIK